MENSYIEIDPDIWYFFRLKNMTSDAEGQIFKKAFAGKKHLPKEFQRFFRYSPGYPIKDDWREI